MSESVTRLCHITQAASRLLIVFAVIVLGLGIQLLAARLAEPPSTGRTVSIVGWPLMMLGMVMLLIQMGVRLRRAVRVVDAQGSGAP